MDFIEKASLQLADDYKKCGSLEMFSSIMEKYLDKVEENEAAAVYPTLPVGKIDIFMRLNNILCVVCIG